MLDMHINRIHALPIWEGVPTVMPLGGGRTNHNFIVSDDTGKYVVRLGQDIPEHHVMRFNELAASRAAHAAGLSPEVVFVDVGITVIRHIESKTLAESDIGQPQYLTRVVELMRRCHHDIPKHLRGPVLAFSVFHVIQDYAATLHSHASSYTNQISEFLTIATRLKAIIGPIELIYGHNDMMAANILDDGSRLWLIDWDYAGFNTPLFDLGGLASNNLLSEKQEVEMLEIYYEKPTDAALLRRFYAMKCAALLRETMWSMVSEAVSDLDIDYASYTSETYARFKQTYETFLQN